ncbi:putative uncharacterized protein DDB_G0282133 isoform X3 [Harpegnathos saltator]|uniref:putative uncharacterized protein DDB_G0282133 isoform X3 n=1 Tax=Harpegnathos saltator TaxID=610380 RepID=UPI00058EBF3D|nr:putative uncharacterized protein DDB_G0282133 isoform X3 [Harpegnathos saltator]
MRNHKATQRIKKQAPKQKTEKLRELYVTLYDLTLYPELVPLRYKLSFRQQLKQITKLSYINTSKNHSNNVQLSRQNVQNANVQSSKSIENSSSRNISERKSIKKHETTKSKLNNKYIKSIKKVLNNQYDKILQSRSRKHKQQSIIDDESSSVTSDQTFDETSQTSNEVASTNTKVLQYARKLTISRENRVDISELDLTDDTSMESAKVGSDDTNYLDKKNLIFIDSNSKNQKVSNKEISIASTKHNYNLSPVNFREEANHKVKQKYSLNKESLTIADGGKKFSTNRLFENVKTNEEVLHTSKIPLSSSNNKMIEEKQDQHNARTKSNTDSTLAVKLKSTAIIRPKKVPTDCVTKNSSPEISKENKSLKQQHTIPKITQDAFLPRGTVKLVRLNGAHISAWKNTLNNDNSKQNGCNNRDKNVKQTLDIDDTLEHTNTLKEKGDHVSSTIIKSINASQISGYISTQKSNTQEDNNVLTDDGLYNKVLSRRRQSFSITTQEDTYENININNINTEAAINTKHNVQDKIQCRKRTAEKNSEDVNTCVKRFKLKRNFQQSNVKPYIEQSNQQQLNDSSSTDASMSKEAECYITDLRKILNRKRNEKTWKLKAAIDDKTIDNTASIEISNEDDTIAVANVVTARNEKTCEKLSSKDKLTFSKDICEKQNNSQVSSIKNSASNLSNNLYNVPDEACHSQVDINIYEDINMRKECTNDLNNNDDCNNEEDYDCISLYAETFDVSQFEDTFPDEREKLPKPLYSDTPYTMSTSSFDKYFKQNKSEFNQEYERCRVNNTENSQVVQNTDNTGKALGKMEVLKDNLLETHNKNQLLTIKQTLPKIASNIPLWRRTVHIDEVMRQTSQRHCPVNSTNLTSAAENTQIFKSRDMNQHFYGFCFNMLIYSTCKQKTCNFKHNFQDFLHKFNTQNNNKIMDMIEFARFKKFFFFCQELYRISLKKLSTDQILKIHQMFYDAYKLTKDITCDVLDELLKRNMPLSAIVESIVASIYSSVRTIIVNQVYLIYQCIEKYIESGKYWYIARSMLPILMPDKRIIENILYDCICNEQLFNVRDIDDILISKLRPDMISQLDKHLMVRFKSLLAKKTAEDIRTMKPVQEFGENFMAMDTIASPDSKQHLDEVESPRGSINIANMSRTNEIEKHGHEMNATSSKCYILHPIDDLPEPRSIYRDHEHLWKFYVDLDRVKQGLKHQDYDYVIDILEEYTEKQDANLFVRSCCNMLRTEIKRSDHHLINIIQRTDKKIICTSRDRWRVVSTIRDERVRNKLMYILLDSLCNGLTEHAFFLFTFLLKDQSSQFYPIDLSRYVNKLITLLLSGNETALIMEMGNLILKYNFPLNTTTCRALITTLIHVDEKLAIQLYCYAEAIGLYSVIKLWPICIIMNNDLTEEEIYLRILRLLEKLKINFGHAIETVKPRSQQIAVFLILEVKSTEQPCCSKQICDNSRAIANIKALIRNVLRKRFDPPISLISHVKEKICRLQTKSLINYLKSEHCN